MHGKSKNNTNIYQPFLIRTMEINASEAESKFALIQSTITNLVFNVISSYEKRIEELQRQLQSTLHELQKIKSEKEVLQGENK